jgi:sideroflexin-2
LGKEPPGTTQEQIKYAKKLFESAFHPDSGEKQNVFGRMSFQVPGGMAITGAMLQFYKTAPAVIFWQWVNQSFNACVNYTNRNANSPVTTTQLGISYVSATSAALITALGYKTFLQKRASPFFQVI